MSVHRRALGDGCTPVNKRPKPEANGFPDSLSFEDSKSLVESAVAIAA